MQPSGQHTRKLLDTDENSAIGVLFWSPDEKRVIYARTDESGDTVVTRDLKGGPATTLFTPSETKNITDYMWLPDGRLIYSAREPTAIGDTCNYWTMLLEAHTGQATEKPMRLTNWTGFCMVNMSVTANGKRLAFLESASQATVYVADLEASGARVVNSRHFTLDGNFDYPQDWTAEGKAILFTARRAGQLGIYKQALDEDTPELIVGGAVGLRNVRESPDGKWVIALRSPIPGGAFEPEQLMRVPITGGSPKVLFPTRAGSKISCARAPSNLCALAEPTEDRKHLIVTAFEPVKGRGADLLRLDLDPDDNWFFDLSNDGTHIAAITGPKGPIRIFSVRGRSPRIIQAKGLNAMQALCWAADGKGLYVANAVHEESVLLYVDLEGNARALSQNHGNNPAIGLPSPDGRHLAILGSTMNSNVWMMENF
jgi:Tol biopolymer transport system component